MRAARFVLLLAPAIMVARASVGSAQSPSTPWQALRDSVAAGELRFFYLWGDLWRTSEAGRHFVALVWPPRGINDPVRSMQAACDTALRPIPGIKANRGDNRIPTRATSPLTGVCPSWLLGHVDPTQDEGKFLDASLTDAARKRAHAARASLIRLLDSAERLVPTDAWIVGQHVRFLLDQQEHARAMRVASECQASAWWCTALRGYALAAMQNYVPAEAAFDTAALLLPDAERCAWTDHRSIVDSAGQREYRAAGCQERQAMNSTLWWLSDPLFTVPGNERKVEQYVRQVAILLRAPLDRDERFEWQALAGGDARREMIARYGWPSYSHWFGYGYDLSRAGSATGSWPMGDPLERSAPVNDVYPTYEYTSGRRHFIPDWTALQSPFSAAASDWAIDERASERRGDNAFGGVGDRRAPWLGYDAAKDAAARERLAWWPNEHIAPASSVVQLPDGQVALLRRQSHDILAIATDLRMNELGGASDAPLRATLVASDAPGALTILGDAQSVDSKRLTAKASIAAHPTVVSLEFPADGDRSAGRLRFGITPPAPLDSMAPGAIAVSAPVLLQAVPDRDSSANADVALGRMATSLAVERGTHLNLYWESYGIAATDTVDVAVSVERYSPRPSPRRSGPVARLAPGADTPVMIKWTETGIPPTAELVRGATPIIGRTVTLDLAGLPAGDYWLDIAISRPGGDLVQGRRGIVIR